MSKLVVRVPLVHHGLLHMTTRVNFVFCPSPTGKPLPLSNPSCPDRPAGHSKPDWTSRSWSSMFSTIFMQLSPQTQSVPTPLATNATPTSAHSCKPCLFLSQSSCSVNLSATSLDNISHTKQSSATSQALSSSTSPSRSLLPRPIHSRDAAAPLRTVL